MGSKYASEYYSKFLFWLFEIKVLNLFSIIDFSYQYLPEAKAYLELSWTSTTELFRGKCFFFGKFTKKYLCQNFSLIKLQLSVLQLYWKKGLQHRWFLLNCEILKTTFIQKTSRRLLLFYGKIFFQQNSKKHSEKRKRMETASEKNNGTHKTKT